MKTNKPNSTIVVHNRRACHEYFIKEKFEAGLVLRGWEVKSLRAGKANICNSYIILKNGEAFLIGANFTPLPVTFLHYKCESLRTRKLLLNQRELNYLYGRINRDGYTVIALSLFWKNAWCKIQIGIATGKKQYDKRDDLKKREWQIDKARIMKNAEH